MTASSTAVATTCPPWCTSTNTDHDVHWSTVLGPMEFRVAGERDPDGGDHVAINESQLTIEEARELAHALLTTARLADAELSATATKLDHHQILIEEIEGSRRLVEQLRSQADDASQAQRKDSAP